MKKPAAQSSARRAPMRPGVKAPARKAPAAPARRPAAANAGRRPPAAPARGNAPARRAAPAKRSSSARKPILWKAPGDYKRSLYEVDFVTEKDGLLGSKIRAQKIDGTYDKAPENKRRMLTTFDTPTMVGIVARLGAAIYHSNPDKRLPPNTMFRVLYGVGVKSDNNALTANIKAIWIGEKKATGRMVQVELDRKDPMFRLIRKSTKFITGAFADARQIPKPVRGKARQDDDGEE